MGLIDKVNVEVNGGSDLLSTLSTYTTKILKPNIVDGKNILIPAMISSKNTKYVIKYDFELEEDITIHENCVLEFDGGSIGGSSSNTLTLNGASIEADNKEHIFKGVTVEGLSWFSVCWFGAKGDDNYDNSDVLRSCLEKDGSFIAYFPAGIYRISKTINGYRFPSASVSHMATWMSDDYVRGAATWSVPQTAVIKCIGDNNGEPFIIAPRSIKNIAFYGETVVATGGENKFKYENSVAIQIGYPNPQQSGFAGDGIYENIAVYYFGTGFKFTSLANDYFYNIHICRNNIGILCDAPYYEGIESGYTTSTTLSNCIINFNYHYGIYRNQSNGSQYQYKMIINGGYVESNNIDYPDDYDIYVNSGTFQLTLTNTGTESIKYIDYASGNELMLTMTNVTSIFNSIIKASKVQCCNCYMFNTTIHVGTGGGSVVASYLYDLIQTSDNDSSAVNIIGTAIRSKTNNSYNKTLNIFPIGERLSETSNPLKFPYSYLSLELINAATTKPQIALVINKYNSNDDTIGRRYVDGRRFVDNAGDTSHRPTLGSWDYGFQYFDITLSKPIYWTGSAWVDANGKDPDATV